MATRPKQTEQDIIADGKHVVGAARDHFAEIMAADMRRKNKLLTEARLTTFESSIANLERAVGGHAVIFSSLVGATALEGQQRSQLYNLIKDIRAEVKLGNSGITKVGRAYGVGVRLNARSTPAVLNVAQRILSAWEEPEYRQAALDAGVAEESIEELRRLTESLGGADTRQKMTRGTGIGQTGMKRQLLRTVRSETAYLRRVARLVFRNQPEVLAEFASALPRRTVQPRIARTAAESGEKK